MSIGKTAKQRLKETIIVLLGKYTFEDITVTEICAESGVSRQLFYHYYKDKYDLVNSIYRKDIDEIVKKLSLSVPWEMMAYHILEYLKTHKKYYSNLFNYSGQNSFLDFFIDYSYDLNEAVVKSNLGTDELSDSLKLCLQFYNNGCVLTTFQWVNTHNDLSPSLVAEVLKKSIPEELKPYYK